MTEIDEAALAARVNARMAEDEAKKRLDLRIEEAKRAPAATARLSPREQQILDAWQGWVDRGRDALPANRQPDPAPALPDGRVPDRYQPGTGVLEASVAEVPPAERSWRELLLSRGCSEATANAVAGRYE
jgi:hypothetical protein